MNPRVAMLGLVLAAFASSSFALKITTYTSARFVVPDAGGYELDGFGRATNAPTTQVASFARALPAGYESFLDIWNFNITALKPGDYPFSFVVGAQGTLEFDSVVLSSYKNGARTAVLFEVSDDGLQAFGSGTFTVEKPCGVVVCVWLDIAGIQQIGGPAGYGGDFQAAAIPEPETYALMLAGLAAVGFAARRRKPATA
ncbi:MAG TPA: FxDxF family PEP-CTERM protein [Rubrivivax sp.]